MHYSSSPSSTLQILQPCVALYGQEKARFNVRCKLFNEHIVNALGAILHGRALPSSYGPLDVRVVGLIDKCSWSLPVHVLAHHSLRNSEIVVDLDESITFQTVDGLSNGRPSDPSMWNPTWWLVARTCRLYGCSWMHCNSAQCSLQLGLLWSVECRLTCNLLDIEGRTV